MSIRTYSLWLTALIGLVALGGCTGLRVTSDFNPALSASVCSTYAWAGQFRASNGKGPTIVNPLMETRLRNALAANLEAKGVHLAAAGTKASCLVGYGIGRRTIVEGAWPEWGWGWGWGWPGPYWDGPFVYHRGLVAVNLYQASDRQPIWHAVVEQDLDELTGRDAEAKMNEAVAALFSRYPQ
jgi:hypothetical protein